MAGWTSYMLTNIILAHIFLLQQPAVCSCSLRTPGFNCIANLWLSAPFPPISPLQTITNGDGNQVINTLLFHIFGQINWGTLYTVHQRVPSYGCQINYRIPCKFECLIKNRRSLKVVGPKYCMKHTSMKQKTITCVVYLTFNFTWAWHISLC